MRIGTLANLTAACAIALALGACQSTKGAGGPTAAAPGPIKTLQEAIGGKPQGALVAQQSESAPQGAPVIAQQPATEVQASAYAPTSAPAASSAPAVSVSQASVAGPITNKPQQAQAKPATQVVPARPEPATSVPTVPVHTAQDAAPAQAGQGGPVRTLVDALRGGSAGSPRGALVPSAPSSQEPQAAPAQTASIPAQTQQPDRLPYDGRVSVQGPQMQTFTISPSMPDPRVQRALRDQGSVPGTADYRPPSDSDLRNLF